MKAPILQEWLDQNPTSALGTTLQTMIDTHSLPFSLLALYPSQKVSALDVWGLDLHDYWPLVYFGEYSNWSPSGKRDKLRRKQRREYLLAFYQQRHQRLRAMTEAICNAEDILPNEILRPWRNQRKLSLNGK